MEADGGSSARKPAVKVASFDLLRGMNRVRGDDDALPLTPVSKSTSGSSHRVSRSSTIATLNELDPSDAVFFDPHLFLLHFLYTTLFPLSLVVQGILRLMSRELSFEAKLSWGACFPYLCFWVYFICDTLTAHPHLENEVAVVAVLMVLISLDTSAACANPHLKRLFRLRDLWESIRGRFRVPRSMVGGVTGMFAAMHAAYVMPHSVSNIAARNVLKNLQIKLKVPNIDNLFEYGYLDYDVSSDGAVISPDTSGQPSSPPSSAMSFPLGESYTSQAVRTREVSLEALGDTLIWGVRPRGIGWCGGFLWRFFSLKKIPLLLVSIVYVGAVCALPFIVRYAKRDIHPSELSTEERWLSAAYIMLVVFIGVQIMAFWVMLTEIFETQHTRMYSLSILLDPAAARTASLPVFDFSNPRHVTAWSVLYEYVAGFSETTVQFFSRRLIIFGLGLGASIAYIIGQVIYQNLSDGAFFGAFTIISFFTFAFYFVIVLIFGMRTNQFLNEFRSAIAKFELNAQLGDYVSQHFDMAHLDDEVSKEEHKNEANADSVRINDAIRLLRAVRSYLRDAPRMSIFGVDLDSGVVGAIGAALISAAGYLVPLFLQVIAADEEQ